MGNPIETCWDELWPIGNILNEVCHGIYIDKFDDQIGSKPDVVYALLKKIAANKMPEYLSDVKTTIELDHGEREIIRRCFDEVVRQVEEWEFQTRVGVTVAEAMVLKEKLVRL